MQHHVTIALMINVYVPGHHFKTSKSLAEQATQLAYLILSGLGMADSNCALCKALAITSAFDGAENG
jgi:uncharacterized membrane protein